MKKMLIILLLLTLVLSLASCESENEANLGQIQGDDKIQNLEQSEPGNYQLNIVSVIASTDDGNIAENMIDSFSDTRWSTDEDGGNTIFDLGEEKNIAAFGISFFKGDIRYTNYTVEVSTDKITWTEVFKEDGSTAT